MDLHEIPTGVWVFLSSALLLLLGRIADKWLTKQADQREDRQDYRAEIKELRERMDGLEAQVSLWRDRYYAEQTTSAGLRVLLIRNGINPDDAIVQGSTPPPA